MIFERPWRSEERYDFIADHLIDGAFVPMNGLHHPFEHRIQKGTRLFSVAVGEELRRPFPVCEEHRDMLALALERRLRGPDFLGRRLGV